MKSFILSIFLLLSGCYLSDVSASDFDFLTEEIHLENTTNQ